MRQLRSSFKLNEISHHTINFKYKSLDILKIKKYFVPKY